MLGFLGYLQHERAMLRDENRTIEQRLVAQKKYNDQKGLEEARYMQGLQVKLQAQYLEADTIKELVQFEHSLEWLEKESPYKPTLTMVNSLRNFIKSDLKIKLLENSKESKKKVAQAQASQTIAKLESIAEKQIIKQKATEVKIQEKIAKDAKIQIADTMAIKQTTGDDRRKVVLKEIICIDPQSNWPKTCDDIYLTINDKRIWKKPLRICQGDRIPLNDNLFFDKKTVLELWEYDKAQDDNLGQIRFSENLTNSEGSAEIRNSGRKGQWHYVIKFKVN